MTATTDATKALDADIDAMRDVYMSNAQFDAYNRILALALARPAGDAVAGVVSGTYSDEYSMALLDRKTCPVGTKLYAAPPAAASDARDAAMWRHCLDKGFPVREQGGKWLAFSGIHEWHYADTPSEAVDAAIAQQHKGAGQ